MTGGEVPAEYRVEWVGVLVFLVGVKQVQSSGSPSGPLLLSVVMTHSDWQPPCPVLDCLSDFPWMSDFNHEVFLSSDGPTKI